MKHSMVKTPTFALLLSLLREGHVNASINTELRTAFLPTYNHQYHTRHTRRLQHISNIQTSILPAKPNRNDEDDIEEEEVSLLQSITDEEALLACRAYLQRKHKLEWTQHERRKRLSRDSLINSSASSSSNLETKGDDGSNEIGNNGSAAVGYFWEDPSELIYLRQGKPSLSEFDENSNTLELAQEEDSDEILNINSDDEDEFLIQPLIMNANEQEQGELYGGSFTTFPTTPPESFVKRSKAKKDLFADPEWKARWYERRWGTPPSSTPTAITKGAPTTTIGNTASPSSNKTSNGSSLTGISFSWGSRVQTSHQKKLKRIQRLVSKIPSHILESKEFAALTDEEIEGAIQTYLDANRKRRETWDQKKEEKAQLQLERSKNTSNAKSEPKRSQSSNSDDSDEITKMKQAQRKRSLRAAKAYQTRLANKAKQNEADGSSTDKKPKESKRKGENIETSSTITTSASKSKVALERIIHDLDTNTHPALADVQSILNPSRLAGRKDILKRILSQCFDLRGKCIPAVFSSDSLNDIHSDYYSEALQAGNYPKKFVTQSSVREIGLFVLYQLYYNSP